ncbi:MAG TPA: murein biosynthesis integral membrane protein MurJ [Motilibacteraceae bacterium]|nr:murein biosynthesis integral membrane protein MurJ [Motilibacteraceae bacterium]
MEERSGIPTDLAEDASMGPSGSTPDSADQRSAARPARQPAGPPQEVSAPSSPGAPTSAASAAGTEGSRLLRSSTLMAAGTVASRLLGFVRSIVLVAAIGTALLGSTYTVANTVPNTIYILLAGGVLNTVFVPQLVRAMKERSDGGEEYAHRLLTVCFTGLAAITLVATLSAPLVVRLYASSSWGGRELEVATLFAYWCLPQILFYGVYTVLGQVLNARGSFGPMMWAPVLNNVVVIAVCAVFIAIGRTTDTATISTAQITLLGVGTTLGVVAQALVLVPVVRRTGYRYRPRFDWRGWGLGRAGGLAGWTLAFVAVNQLGYLVISRVLTGVDQRAAEAGLHYGVGLNAYTNAFLVFQLPHAVVTVSVVTAMLPRMSAAFTEGRLDEVRDDLSQGLRLVAVVVVPAAVAFLVLGPEIGTVLYGSAAGGAGSGRAIGEILAGFGLALVPFSAQYLLLRGFYAQDDTRTPFLVACVINVVNVAGSLLAAVVLPLTEVATGLGVVYGLAYAVGWLLSLVLLRRRLAGGRPQPDPGTGAVPGPAREPVLDDGRSLRLVVRVTLAAALAGIVAVVVVGVLERLIGTGVGAALVTLVVAGAVLAIGYLALATRMRVEELTSLLGPVRARLPRRLRGA